MSSGHKKFLISIVGPTAVGKTSVAVTLAKWLNTEIISADSRQFFSEMEIGTAKPTREELTVIKHHLINSRSIHEAYDVGQFEKESLTILDDLFKKKDHAILVGGSGLYCQALWHGLDEFPEVAEEVRSQLIDSLKKNGIEVLQKELEETDPEYYQHVDKQNPQRLIRALEVIRTTGQTFSFYRKQNKKKVQRPFHVVKIGLDMARDVLYQRIDDRMDDMISKGLFAEAEALYPFRKLNALRTVGYTEVFDFLSGKYDKEEAIRLLKRNSRRYAKRQLTWFRKDTDIQWYDPSDLTRLKDHLTHIMN